ncbi:MAG: SDR family NAD(P)-dependent oxidoreductase [Clostridia bacterium]|nr:SDR family NAD(P)-dependent oxidoreductase [Clostridia bacterium]
MQYENFKNEIAIIGMSGRYPGAPDLDSFWQNLKDGKEGIRFFSDEELYKLGVPEEHIKAPNFVKAASTIDSIDCFDAGFFGYSPKEAKLLDPQQRIFLECAWNALENGGYSPESYSGAIGVYGSSSLNTYLLFNLMKNPLYSNWQNDFEVMVGNDKNFLSTRVAYHMNLKGPAVDIQTACSSSLVAIHFACNALLNYECDMALAGGVSIYVPQRTGYFYQEGGIMSPDGKCRAFDKKSCGTVFGNGVGILLLKRLSEALEDNDTIHAVIKSTAINNDGSQKVGYTAPSVDGQVELITRALALADVSPESVSYVEAHGTGTVYGDPVEVAALTKSFFGEEGFRYKQYCALGSVKTNIGHLDAASGVTGVIKTVLALKNKEIPPTISFNEPNPKIDFINSPFYVNTQLKKWSDSKTPRRAGVNSLGIGGTNAFIVLEEPPQQLDDEASPLKSRKEILLLSARSEAALKRKCEDLHKYLLSNKQASTGEIGYTLHVGRKMFPYRQFIVCESTDEMISKLSPDKREEIPVIHCDKINRPAVFVFPDHGEQYITAGYDLYKKVPQFKESVDRCAQIVLLKLNKDIRSFLCEDNPDTPKISDVFPLFFAFEYALAQLLIKKGINPSALIGSGLGEYSAACIAGIMSLEEALSIVMEYSSLFEQQGIVLVSEIASISENGLKAIVDAITLYLKEIRLKAPKIPLMNPLTGLWITEQNALNAAYWANVRFIPTSMDKGFAQLLEEPSYLFLELGAGNNATSKSIKAVISPERRDEILPLICACENHNKQREHLAYIFGRYLCYGGSIQIKDYYENLNFRRIPLPGYPFERQSYWINPAAFEKETPKEPDTIEKNTDISKWFYMPVWKRTPAPPPPMTVNTESWLVFIRNDDFSGAFLSLLKRNKQHIITVACGEHFQKTEEDTFTISPGSSEDYCALLDDLKGRKVMPQKLIYLWLPRETEVFDDMKLYGFDALIYLIKAWENKGFRHLSSLWIAGTNTYKVEHNDVVNPYSGLYCGLAKTIPQEYNGITCHTIDIWQWDKSCTEQFLTEILSEPMESEIAYRKTYRFIQEIQPLSLGKNPHERCSFREKGTYLITGGLGKLGLIFAEYLARFYKANIILTGRSPFPDRAAWQQHLKSNSPFSSQIKKIIELEELGGNVLVHQANIADAAQLEALVNTREKQFGALNGVIHCAGITGGRAVKLLADYEAKDALEQFEAKIKGTALLAEIARQVNPDFVLLVSSITSVLGGAGLSLYTAANMFLDGFVKSSFTNNQRWLSMNLDWIYSESHRNITAEFDKFAITSEEITDVFHRVVTQSVEEQVIVSTGDLRMRIKELGKKAEKKSPRSDSKTLSQRPPISTPYVPPYTEKEKIVAGIWGDELEIDKIGRNDNFFELGGNSLIAISVVSKLKKEFGIDIPTVSLYEKLTPYSLAAEIARIEKESLGEQAVEKKMDKENTYEHRRMLLQNQRKKRIR